MLKVDQIIYISCLVISFILMVIFFTLHFVLQKRNHNQNFLIKNGHDSAWAFTKRNFWMFSGSFALVMVFSFGALLLSTY